MSTTLFLVGEDKLAIENEHVQTFVLQDGIAELPQNEETYREIINNYEDDFVIVDLDRTFRFITENLETVHGYNLDETEGLNVLTFIHPKDMPEFGNNLMEYHKTLEVKNNIGPIRIKTKSGQYIPYLVSLIPITDENGEKIVTAVTLKDVSTPLGEISEVLPGN
jgi:PAS domain S-box-containing protein